MPNILICDDERSICEMLDITLRREGYKVETVTSGEAAKRKIESALYDIIVTDIKMPAINGIEVLRHAHKLSPETAVILITAVDDYEAAVQAVKAGGAADYIRKSPGLIDEIKLAIRKALEKVTLSRQNFALNSLPISGHEFIADDVRPVLRRLARRGQKFDAIILDPPTFSRTKRGDAFHVEKDFEEIIIAALELIERDGRILLSTNCAALHERALEMMARYCLKASRRAGTLHRQPPPADFPPGSAASTVWLTLR